MWTLPLLIVITSVVLSIPGGYYLAWIVDGRYRAPAWLQSIEGRLNTGVQGWKQYVASLLLFNTVLFGFAFVVLSLQPVLPYAPAGKGMLAPGTTFNSAVSFFTNTDLQDYSGEQHLSYFSQIFFAVAQMFFSAAIGFCALTAVIRGLRGDSHMGNFYVDMWRVLAYALVPASVLMGLVLIPLGVPMTLEPTASVSTLEAGAMGRDDAGVAKPQEIARGPVAALIPIKHLGTNGSGFFGANSCHPYENPSDITNFLTCVNILFFPLSLVVMFGRMLKNMGHAAVLYATMMVLFAAMIGWAVVWERKPNPALTAPAPLANPAGKPFPIQPFSPDGKPLDKTIDVPALPAL